MLMEIDPLLIRGSMVMKMVMISPSRRDVSPAEQFRRRPRLVPSRFRLMSAVFRPKSFRFIFESMSVFDRMTLTASTVAALPNRSLKRLTRSMSPRRDAVL